VKLEHFLREKAGNSAKCKVCSTILKVTKGPHEHEAHSQRQHNETNDPQQQSTETGVQYVVIVEFVPTVCCLRHWVTHCIPGNDIFPLLIPGNEKSLVGINTLLRTDDGMMCIKECLLRTDDWMMCIKECLLRTDDGMMCIKECLHCDHLGL